MDATSSWVDGGAVLYAQGGLDLGAVHTITLRDYSDDDPFCNILGRVCCISLDALVLLKPGPP